MGATLSLKKTDVEDKPEHGPAFNPDAHFGEVGGMDGVGFVQGKALFDKLGRYVRPAPKEMWLAPLTPAQEQQRKMQIVKNKRFFGSATARAVQASMPQTVIDAERENAQARAAESQAA